MSENIRSRLHTQVWDQQVNERRKPWEAFQMYRDWTPADRSIRVVAERLGKSRVLLERWSKEFSWVDRVREYDQWIDRQTSQEARLENEKKRVEMLSRHTANAVFIQNKLIQQIKDMSEKDWKAVPFGQKISAFQLMAQFERLSRGLPSDSIEVRTPEQIRMHQVTEARLYWKEVEHDFPFLPQADRLRIVCEEFEVTPEELSLDGVAELSDQAIG